MFCIDLTDFDQIFYPGTDGPDGTDGRGEGWGGEAALQNIGGVAPREKT